MSVASSFAGDGDGSTLDSSRPGEHGGAMSSPDDRPGPGQSPSPNARASQVPDPEPPGDPAPGPASTGGAEPDPDSDNPADSDPDSGHPASTGGAEPDPEPFSTPVSCGNTEPSGDPGAGAGLDSGPPRETAPSSNSGAPGETAPSSSSGAPRETAPGPGAPGEVAPSSSPGAPSPRPQQPRPPRSGAELAHLVLISILLGTALMGPIQMLAQIMPNQPSLVPLILNNIILNKSIWLPVGALVFALRRRPTTLSTALALIMLLEYVPFLGAIPVSAGNLAPFVPIYLTLALAAAGAVVGALANRSLDGRPIPVTLAGGVCAGALTRSAIDLAHRLYQMLDEDAALLLSARQWDNATFLGLIDVPPGLIPVLTAVAAVAAAVGLTGFWSARGARSRVRLLTGSLAAAVVTIVLVGLLPTSSSALNDLGAGFSPLTVLPLIAPVPLLMAGLVALPACGRWFERR